MIEHTESSYKLKNQRCTTSTGRKNIMHLHAREPEMNTMGEKPRTGVISELKIQEGRQPQTS